MHYVSQADLSTECQYYITQPTLTVVDSQYPDVVGVTSDGVIGFSSLNDEIAGDYSMTLAIVYTTTIEYTFGAYACSAITHDSCGGTCDWSTHGLCDDTCDCKLSWPTGDNRGYDSPDAVCQC